MTRILGIETSCDETGVAVVEEGRRIVSHEVASQVAIHAEFGGVVPEIASRQHTSSISQLVEKVMADAGGPVDAVAATLGPGLMGSLMVGANFAKALAYAWDVPFIPVHHIEGHIFSVFIAGHRPEYPFLALLVSGGHTALVMSPEPHRYTLLGTTRDDAVGECFDKVARLLGLPYPGGPSIERAAEGGRDDAIAFPRGMAASENLDFSYSGLKTAVLYHLKQRPADVADHADVAASFQAAAVDALMIKTRACVTQTGAPRLIVAGGVAANRRLRERLASELSIPVLMPPIDLCIDNGAMIAAAGHSRLAHGLIGDLRATPSPNLPLA